MFIYLLRLIILLIASIKIVFADVWPISNEPLFIPKSTAPIVTLIVDDSGSTLLESTPQSDAHANMVYPSVISNTNYYAVSDFHGTENSKLVRDPETNPLYFDPFKIYKPWVKADGTLLDNAKYNKLYKSPFTTHPDDKETKINANCKTADLTDKVQTRNCFDFIQCNMMSKCLVKKNATYFPGDMVYFDKPYRLFNKQDIKAGFFYANSPALIHEDVRDNAANWYTYYRDRKNTIKAALGYSIHESPKDILLGYTTLDYAKNNSSSPLSFSNQKLENVSDKETLYDLIYNDDQYGEAPLREALVNVSDYIKKTDALWTDSGTKRSCRRAYNVIISDGNWTNLGGFGGENSDGEDGPKIESEDGLEYKYDPNAQGAYSDAYKGTIADIAMEFWKTDIRKDIKNDSPFNSSGTEDSIFWQNITTNVININNNVDGNIPATWPDVTDDSNLAMRYLDLWHAALNTKGQYIFAGSFNQISDALMSVFNKSVSVGYINAGMTNNEYHASENSMLYKTYFDPINWSGEVKAYKITNIENSTTEHLWTASEQLPEADSRNMFLMTKTLSSSSIVPFRWNSLSNDDKTKIGTEEVLDYIRGNRTKEGYLYSGITDRLRVREGLLGDFINAAPVYTGPPPYSYNFDNYDTFKTSKANRLPVVYAASNSGFVHAFNANTGSELFSVGSDYSLNKIAARTDVDYSHQYILDGTPVVADVYLNNSWQTILISPMGAGGQSVFSLNITNPETITETNSGSLTSLGSWQFNDSNDKDLGYTFAKPVVVQINSEQNKSKWVVLLGNGYNNTEEDDNYSGTGNAALYILDAANGSIIKKLDTEEGINTDGKPNGLSTPAAIDTNNDGKVDYIFAGDIFGNLWKFDLSSKKVNDWNVRKIFSNTADDQSITTLPQVMKHPSKKGLLILFGTGMFLNSDYNNNNSFYAIYDDLSGTTVDNDNLVKQTITIDGDSRTISNNTIDWEKNYGWYINLPGNELVITNPVLSMGNLIINTYAPDTAKVQCVDGQKAYIYALDPATGSAPYYTVLNAGDKKTVNKQNIAGFLVDTKYKSSPIIMKSSKYQNKLIMNTKYNNVINMNLSTSQTFIKRRSWKKIRALDTEKINNTN